MRPLKYNYIYMKYKKLIVFPRMVAMICVMVVLSCAKKESSTSERSGLPEDLSPGMIVADTITYEVIISNTDPENTWAEECLRNLDHKALIDNIFSMISDDRAVAYDYSSRERLTDKQLKDIESEPGYARSEIGMIQFTEIWFLDPDKGDFTKKVHSMVLGYNFYTSDGDLFGHRPLFRVEL